MKIIIDDDIPYIKGVLEPFADVLYKAGKDIIPKICKHADALIIRTRTVCDRNLLEGSKVAYIGTATIGYDHIDTNYCEQTGIRWDHAPGCNAKSVEQYIASALFSYAADKGMTLQEKTIGIVGVGNVGKNVEQFCRTIGMQVLLNDPPRQRREHSNIFVPLDKIQCRADVITFHVPLTKTGRDATHYMVDSNFLNRLHKYPLLINASRGEIFDTNAIKKALTTKKISGFVADCWEDEPVIDRELLDLSHYGTPHIAGYSRDGKANGTMAIIQSISRFFNFGIDDWRPQEIEPPENPIITIDGTGQEQESMIAKAILSTYDIKADDRALKNNPACFEEIRKTYGVRREFPSYIIQGNNIPEKTYRKLQQLGFK